MKSFHDYASLKTTGQLVMDLGSISTHIRALVALLRQYDVNKNLSTQVLLWVLVGTIIFQPCYHIASLVLVTFLCIFVGIPRLSLLLCVFLMQFAYKWQVIIAVGLYIFRTLDLNDEINHRIANRWNIVFFVSIFLIAVLETFIGAYEKFGLEHPHMANGSHVSSNEPF